MGPVGDGTGRVTVCWGFGRIGVGGTVLGAEGEQAGGIRVVPTRTGNPSHTVLWRQLINILVGREVNAAQANVAEFQLGIAEQLDFSCQVPLPAIGEVRAQLHALGWRTARGVKVVHVLAWCKGGAVERALRADADRERGICADEPGASAADRIASEELPNSRAQHKLPVAERVPCETKARRNQ